METNLNGLLRHFSCVQANNTAGFFFTLNQDIFIERCYNLGNKKPLNLPGPGVCDIPRSVIDAGWNYDLEDEDFITLKDSYEISINSLSPSEFHYIKLHGSYNWLSSDGSNAMVIGLDKKSRIKEPLLIGYFELF